MEGEVIMSKAGKTGVTTGTPKNILFGAGTIHKNLEYKAESGWNFEESIIGATSGGSKVSITPEFYDVEVDGVLVPTKGLKQQIGETAEMEINFVELTEEIIKSSTIGKNGSSEDSSYTLIESKSSLSDGDYYDNIAFVGQMLDGRNIIVIFENTLCTSGMEQEGKSKEGAVGAYTFACHADIEDDTDLDTLPWKIYYPKVEA